MNKNEQLGLRIKLARKQKNLTQQQLADLIEKTESSIRKYEKGLIEIPASVLEKIAVALDTTSAYLNGWSVQGKNEKFNKELQFKNYLVSLGYKLHYDDPEHNPFLRTPEGNWYALKNDDLRKFDSSSEAFIKYTISEILKDREIFKRDNEEDN